VTGAPLAEGATDAAWHHSGHSRTASCRRPYRRRVPGYGQNFIIRPLRGFPLFWPPAYRRLGKGPVRSILRTWKPVHRADLAGRATSLIVSRAPVR
jgi:hypothetical protein